MYKCNCKISISLITHQMWHMCNSSLHSECASACKGISNAIPQSAPKRRGHSVRTYCHPPTCRKRSRTRPRIRFPANHNKPGGGVGLRAFEPPPRRTLTHPTHPKPDMEPRFPHSIPPPGLYPFPPRPTSVLYHPAPPAQAMLDLSCPTHTPALGVHHRSTPRPSVAQVTSAPSDVVHEP